MNEVKRDFAAQFVASAATACASVKGREFPDPKSGSPMAYTAAGVLSWGNASLDYVKEPFARLTLSNSRAEKTFSFGVDIYNAEGNRKYVAGLIQLKGASLSATVTDETKAPDGNTDLTTGNLCVGSTPPPLVTQGAWPFAAKYLQTPKTTMSCAPIGKAEFVDIEFSFDGNTLRAGDASFNQADSAFAETLMIDPRSNGSNIMYSVDKSDGSGAALGMVERGKLSYAMFTRADKTQLLCTKK